jgi:hypothetical protein
LGRIEAIRRVMAKSGMHGSAEAVQLLKTLEPELFKEVRKRMNSELKPILNPIKSEINSQVTNEIRTKMVGRNRSESGMFHNGRSAWSGVNITPRVSTRPKDLIFINATGRTSQFGFDYAELAGIRRRPPRPVSKTYTRNGESRTHRVNGQGDAFIRKLQKEFGKPGRFAWIRVLRRKPEIEQKVQGVADEFGIKLSRRLA